MSPDILFKKDARKTTCDNFCIDVEFDRTPMKNLLVLVRTIPKKFKKCLASLLQNSILIREKVKTTHYSFQSKTMTGSHYAQPINAMQLALSGD